MERKSFIIRFDIWLVKSSKLLTMQAIAQSDSSENSYLIHSFSKSFNNEHCNGKLTLPYMPVCCIDRNGKKIWVHTESEKETTISSAIGKAIEQFIKNDTDTESISHSEPMHQEKRRV